MSNAPQESVSEIPGFLLVCEVRDGVLTPKDAEKLPQGFDLEWLRAQCAADLENIRKKGVDCELTFEIQGGQARIIKGTHLHRGILDELGTEARRKQLAAALMRRLRYSQAGGLSFF